VPRSITVGRGIFLTSDAEHLSRHTVCKNGESAIVQEYLARPLLLDGFKFDLRIYVLVTSFSPLRVFMYKDGLVRLSTSRYQAPNKRNINDLFMSGHIRHTFDLSSAFRGPRHAPPASWYGLLSGHTYRMRVGTLGILFDAC